MSTATRRVFLEVIGVQAAACAFSSGCRAPGPIGSGMGVDVGAGTGGMTRTADAAVEGGGAGRIAIGSGGSGGAGGQPGAGDAGVVGPGANDLIGANLDELLVGTILQVPGEWIAVARDAGGVYAMGLVCTHLGCEIAPSGSGAAIHIDCPCHGSSFDANGAVVRGPATLPLTHLAVDLDADGNIVVHTTTAVPASARLPV